MVDVVLVVDGDEARVESRGRGCCCWGGRVFNYYRLAVDVTSGAVGRRLSSVVEMRARLRVVAAHFESRVFVANRRHSNIHVCLEKVDITSCS